MTANQPPWGPGQPGGFQQSSYGGFGAFSDEDSGGGKPRRTKWLVIGAVVALLLVAGGVTAWLLGLFAGDVLDKRSVEEEMVRVLTESYGEPEVTNPDCPSRQPIKAGHTFPCTVDIAGAEKTVTIRVLNDKPEFEVGAPE